PARPLCRVSVFSFHSLSSLSMKPSMRDRLEQLAHRLIEIDALLSEPEIASDMDRFRKLSRERSELEPVVLAFRGYTQTQTAMSDAQELMVDPEMRELAQEEFETARNRLDELADELQLLLLPRDPDDHRSVYLEIRAGTGGDESALFAGDLLRMYSRYAESKGWRVEIVSARSEERR